MPSVVAVPTTEAIILPADISPKLAAKIGLQGLTADFLVYDLGTVQAAPKFLSQVSVVAWANCWHKF